MDFYGKLQRNLPKSEMLSSVNWKIPNCLLQLVVFFFSGRSNHVALQQNIFSRGNDSTILFLSPFFETETYYVTLAGFKPMMVLLPGFPSAGFTNVYLVKTLYFGGWINWESGMLTNHMLLSHRQNKSQPVHEWILQIGKGSSNMGQGLSQPYLQNTCHT